MYISLWRSLVRPACLLGALLLAPAAALAATPVEQHNSNAIWFENWTGLRNATLVVSAPDGSLTTVEAAAGTPVFQLSGAEILDGIYRFELRAATDEQIKILNPQNNGRGEAQLDSKAKPFYMSGHFTVSRGVIIIPEEISESDTN
ncbi:MAG: hypothetical protein COB16_11565 [Rhodobacteraceae bacterium]|nr:MAG: hypothetical protein COB16_11565 [Paracoccaceae bacterium]